jgi:hypothetical protein
MKKVMLHQGIKLLVMFFLIATVVSCSKYKKYDAKEIQETRKRSMDRSLSILGHDEYWDIYNKINDSINVWKANDLKYYRYFGVSKGYMVDSVLCVNKNGDKLITSILLQQLLKDGEQDDVWYFYGVKVKGNWYFFDGATIVVSRGYYQKYIHQPVSYEVLSQIATSNIYRSYLKKNEQGEWEINERFFERISSKNSENRGYGGCVDCKTEEEYYMHLVERNWKNRK